MRSHLNLLLFIYIFQMRATSIKGFYLRQLQTYINNSYNHLIFIFTHSWIIHKVPYKVRPNPRLVKNGYFLQTVFLAGMSLGWSKQGDEWNHCQHLITKACSEVGRPLWWARHGTHQSVACCLRKMPETRLEKSKFD